MKEAGYVIFTIRPDPVNPFATIMLVQQAIYRGQHPAFWSVLEIFKLDGRFGTKYSHQVKLKLPEGTYLTFI